MPRRNAQHDLAALGHAAVRAVHGLGTQQLHQRFAIVRKARLQHLRPGSGEERVRRALCLGNGALAANRHHDRDVAALCVSGGDLVLRTRRTAPRTADAHAASHASTILDAVHHVFDLHLREVADHIRQFIPTRVADLIQQLLAHGCAVDQPAFARRLKQLEHAVCLQLNQRVAHVHPVRDLLPIGEQTARTLRAALHEMSGEAGLRERVVLRHLPAEFMDRNAEQGGAVHAASGDHNVGSRVERLRDRQGSQIGVGRHELGQIGRGRVCGPGPELRLLRQHIVAGDDGHLQLHALLPGDVQDRIAATGGVQSTGIRD